jgi:TaqI-like C-terminal specificity domain/Eco57I restriction-modification methylase
MLAFISPNKWFRAKYGEKLRKHIAETCQIHSITDFGELPVFKSAATFPMIFIGQNGKIVNQSTLLTQVKSLEPPYPDILEIIRDKGRTLANNAINGSNWILVDTSSASRMKKMEETGIPLGEYVKGNIYRGVLTGFNKAFVIDDAKRAELIAQDPKSAEIIKPLAMGDDVRKWRIKSEDKWLIFTRRGIDINAYPAIKFHLAQWQKELTPKMNSQQSIGRKPGSYKWYEIQDNVAYFNEFEKSKIIFPDIAKESRFSFDNVGNYLGNTAYIIPVSDLYLLGILNSSLVWEYAKANFSCLGDPEKGGRFRFIYQSVVKIPISNASTIEQKAISKLVQKCLDTKGVDCEAWEKEINERVDALYGL